MEKTKRLNIYRIRGDKIGRKKRSKKKWGKIGAPKSAKRKAYLKKIRKKR